ncbi:MAG TPA: sialidase family protein [Candidatus Thermoplasmatota archaeon]|nr:sialidase family protein [Candidatus Thermoplasmatota archaeon]
MRRALVLLLTILAAGAGASASAGEALLPGAFLAPSLPSSLAPSFPAAASGGAEPSILATSDGALWIGDTSGLAKSTDGGATWHHVDVGFLGGLFTDGWALAEDDVGTLYVAVTNGQMLSTASTKDGGATWTINHLVDVSTIADRPWIAARGDGEVAVVYNDAKTTRELCVHSTDGGFTWLDRYVGIQASPNAGNVVFWPDGGLSYSVGTMSYKWSAPCSGEPQKLPQGNSGAQIFTQAQVSGAGDLYLARPTADNGAMTVSATHGMRGLGRRTLTLSPPELRSNTYGTVSVNDAGDVAVAWYGSTTPGSPSADGFSGSWNVYVSIVHDFWGTPVVTTTRVTSVPNHVGGFCFSGIACTSGDRDLLDYMMVDLDEDGVAHLAYGHDGAGSSSEVRYARVA